MLWLTPVLFSFWVCEKSDGLRVLLLVVSDPASGEQTTYIASIQPTVFVSFARMT